MTATFRINQGAGLGTWGRARRDITPFSVGGLVTLEAQAGHVSYFWEVATKPFDAIPVLATPNAITCTLSAEHRGGYLIRLTVDAGLSTESILELYLGIALDTSACVLPASNETVQDNSQAPFFDGREGWWEKLERWFKWADTALGSILPNAAWQEQVIDQGINIPPVGPFPGDRYILGLAPVGLWAGHPEDVAEFDGIDWIFTPQEEGFVAWVYSTHELYIYDGAAWVPWTGTIIHNALGGLQGGWGAERYHLSLAQHTGLTGGAVTALHKHTLDTTYDGGRTITADAGAVTITVPDNSNCRVLELTQNDVTNNPEALLITNAGSNASIQLAGATRWIESDSGSLRIQLTAADANAYNLQIFAENLGLGGTADIGIKADNEIIINSTAGKLSLHGYDSAGTGVEIEATVGGGAISIGGVALTNQINIGTGGARNIYLGSAVAASLTLAALGASSWTVDSAGATPATPLILRSGLAGSKAATLELLSGGDVGLTCVATSAGAQRLIIAASNAGVGTAIVDIDADDAITIDSLAGGISIDAALASNFSTAAGMLSLYGADGMSITGGAGGHITINANIAKSIAIGNVASSTIGIGANATTSTTIGNDAATTVSIRAGGVAGNGLSVDASGVSLTAGIGVLALGSIASIDFTDGYKAAGGYAGTFKLAAAAGEYTTFEGNFGEVSLLNALNQCASFAVTLDEAYNASGGASTIAVDAGDVTWNVGAGATSLYSFVVDVSACLGVIDGFQVLNGADFFKVLRTGAATLDLSAELGTFDINCFSALTLDSTTQTFTTTGIWDVNAAGAITLDSSGGSIGIGVNADAWAIDIGTGAAARTITIGNTANTTEVEIDAKVVDVNVLNTSTWSTGTFALDTTGTCDIDSGGVLSLNSSAIINIGNDANAFGINVGTGAAQRNLIFGNVTGTSSTTVNTGTGGFQVNTTGTGTVDINGTNAVTIDAAAGLSLDGVGASNLTATSGTLTLSTLVSGTLIVNSIGLLDIDAAANIDMDVTGTFDMLSTGVFSIDGTGASNVTASSGNLTLSTLVSGGLILNSVGIVDIDGLVSTWNATSLTLTTSLVFDVNSTGAVTLDAAGASAITIGGDANTGAAGFGTGGDRAVTVGSVTGAASLGIRTGTGGMVFTAGGIWDVNAVGAITLDSTAGTIGIGTGADAFAVNLGTAGVRPVTVGSVTGVSNTTIQAGTGILSLSGLGFIDFSDGYKAGSTYAGAMHFSAESAEWSSFEINYGEVSLLNALNQSMGLTTLNAAALAFNDFTIGSIHVLYTATGICTITIDSDQVARINRTLTIKDVGFNASTNNIIVETEGAELIEGQNNLVVNIDGGSVTLQSNGTNWFIV